MIGILYEHPEWFAPLFAELDRRSLSYQRIPAHMLRYDPAARAVEYDLLFNRMSPSAYLRDHGRAIFAAQQFLLHHEALGTATVNGSNAYALELSKARQLDLLARLGLPAPRTRVVNDPAQISGAADELEFPLIVKPNVGGSGALMQRFSSASELDTAVTGGAVADLFAIDGTALVQEYHAPRGGAIVRVEVLDGEVLYAIRIHNDPNQGFNLCPADICQMPTTPNKMTRTIEAVTPPDWIAQAVLRICAAGGLDLGGVEYLESDRDGRVYFYDINALSNFVTDAPRLVGFDPFVRLVDYLERRLPAGARAALSHAGA